MEKYRLPILFIILISLNSCDSNDPEPIVEIPTQKVLKSITNDSGLTVNFSYDSDGNLTTYKAENIGVEIKYDWENGRVKKITSTDRNSNETKIYNFFSVTSYKSRANVQTIGPNSQSEAIVEYNYSDGLLTSVTNYPVNENIYNGLPDIEFRYYHDYMGNLYKIERMDRSTDMSTYTSKVYFTDWDEDKKPLPHFGAQFSIKNWYDIPILPGFDLSKNNVLRYQSEVGITKNTYEYDNEGYVSFIKSFGVFGQYDFRYTYE